MRKKNGKRVKQMMACFLLVVMIFQSQSVILSATKLSEKKVQDKKDVKQSWSLDKVILNNHSRIYTGFWHSGALNSNGDLYCWGSNSWGEIGNDTKEMQLTPAKILNSVASISMGGTHSSAVTINGDLYCWGDNQYGQVGNGTKIDQITPTKVLEDVVYASMGRNYSSAITANGDLYCWGRNEYGQVGNGTKIDQITPTKVLSNVVYASMGMFSHSSAITANGDLYCWGWNRDGQIGNGDTIDQVTPVKVLSNVKTVSLGSRHSSAITMNGDLYCWGDNCTGEIGNGTKVNQTTPTKVLNDVVFASMGALFSSAITTNGDLYCWGDNEFGQVGNGTMINQTKPVKVMSKILSVCVGGAHCGAIDSNGDLYCWGNTYGPYTSGKEENQLTPIKKLSDVKLISMGDSNGSAITTNGDLYCWGHNEWGVVGNGTTENQSTPVKIMNLGISKISCQQSVVLTDGTKSLFPVRLHAKNEQELDDIADSLTVISGDKNICTAHLYKHNYEKDTVPNAEGEMTQATYFVELVGNSPGNTEITVSAGDDTSIQCQVIVTEFNEYIYRANYYSDDANTGAKGISNLIDLETPCKVLNKSAEEVGLKNSVDAWNNIKNVFNAVDDPTSLGDIAVKQKDIYAALLMNLLESSFTYSTVNQQVKEAAKLDKKFLSSVKNLMEIKYKIDIYDANDFKNLNFEQKQTLSKHASEWFAAEFRIFDNVGDVLTGITTAFDTVGSIEDYYNRVVSCMILHNMGGDMKTVLRQAYSDSKATGNSHLQQALQDCVEIIDSSVEEFIEKMVMEGVTTVGVNTGKWLFGELLWNDIKAKMYVAHPVTAVLMATYKGVSFAVNELFSTDKISEQYLKMLAMEDIEDLLGITYKNMKSKYTSTWTQDTASAYLSSIELISMAKDDDCEQAYKFVDIVDNAVASKIAHFFGASDNSETKDKIQSMQKKFLEDYKDNSMKWMDNLASSVYTYYKNLYLESYRKRVKQITVACPVDVYVYDSDSVLVASSVGDVLSCSSDAISIVRVGEEKIFLFYDDQNYNVEYVGNGSGVMDVTVKEYDENEMEIRTVNYYDVELNDGKTYEMPVEGKSLAVNSYGLQEKNVLGKIEKDYDSLGENKVYKTKIFSGNMIYKEGMFLEADIHENECVEIHAYVPEGMSFVRWESSTKNNIFADASARDTTFVMPAENCEITAILENGNSGDSDITDPSCPHQYVWVTDKLPTQTEDGSKHQECLLCGDKKAPVIIPKITNSKNNDFSNAVIILSPNKYTYNGWQKRPIVTVKLNGKTLKENEDYLLIYHNNIDVGTAQVIIIGKGKYTGYKSIDYTIAESEKQPNFPIISCKKKVYKTAYGAKPFTINATSKSKLLFTSCKPGIVSVDKNTGQVTVKGTGIAGITIKAGRKAVSVLVKVSPKEASLKSVRASNGRRLTVKWAKDKMATGYQVQVSTAKNFKKNLKKKNLSGTSYTFTKLKTGKKYYVRVRSYKKCGKETLYGTWSRVKQSNKIKN